MYHLFQCPLQNENSLREKKATVTASSWDVTAKMSYPGADTGFKEGELYNSA